MLYATMLVLSAGTSLALTRVVRWAARRLGVVDKPDGFRKLQERPIPRLGGVAIYGAFFASLLCGAWLSRRADLWALLASSDFLAIFVGATAVLLVGLRDDVRRLRPRTKFLALTLVAAGMCVAGYRVEAVSNPLGGTIHLGLLSVPLTLFWFLGCMNAMNLIDGMDGLATGIAVFASAVLFVGSILLGNPEAAVLSIAFAGAAAGFLLFNFPPASIFLGDSGSYLLGFILAAIGMRGSQKSHMAVALAIPVIALGVPVMDTALAIMRRWAASLPLSASDRKHIHHKLLDLGLSRRKAVLVMYAACLVLAGFALLMTAAADFQGAIFLGVLGAGTCVAVRLFGRSELALARKRGVEYFRRRRREAECRTAGHAAVERMRHGKEIESIWQCFCQAAEQLELDGASMTIWLAAPADVAPCTFSWAGSGHGAQGGERSALWSASLPLTEGGVEFGTITVTKATNGSPLEPSVPEMLEMLRAAVGENVLRVGRVGGAAPGPANLVDFSQAA